MRQGDWVGHLRQMSDDLRVYRGWFYAAAAYNLLWGLAVIFVPSEVCHLLGLKLIEPQPIFQSLGMVIGTFAIGYYLLARDPRRFGP